jgi:phosphatidylglycerophosphate synthase
MSTRWHRRLRWLPNAITAVRLAGVPVVWALARPKPGRRTSPAAAYVFGAVAATDYVDGALARRLRAESDVGRIADPAVDRLLNLVGIAALIRVRRLGPLGPAILILREVLSVVGYLVARRRGVVLHVDTAGKGSSALTMLATALALWRPERAFTRLFDAAVVASLATFGHYVWTARRASRAAQEGDDGLSTRDRGRPSTPVS